MLGLQVVACFCTKFINMKNLFFSIRRATVLLAFFAFSNVLLAQPPVLAADELQTLIDDLPPVIGCPPDTISGEQCGKEKLLSAVVSPLAAEFPNCKLKVNYKYRLCAKTTKDPITGKSTTKITIKVYDYDIDFSTATLGCAGLIAKFGDFSVSGEDFLRDLNVSIGRQLLDKEANTYIVNSGSTNTYDCNNPTAKKLITAEFYQSSCISVVEGIKDSTKFVKQLPCASSACCGFQRVYCYNNQQKKLVFVEDYLPAITTELCGGSLPTLPPFFSSPKVKDVRQGPCFSICGTLRARASGLVQEFKVTIDGKPVEMKVYPNPSSNFVNIFFDADVKGTIELIDIKGALIETIQTETGSAYLDVSTLAKGVYLIKFTDTKGGMMNQKISID